MIVLAAASIAPAATTDHPATDELRVLGIGLVRRRLRRAGGIVLMLALVTAALLVATIIRGYR